MLSVTIPCKNNEGLIRRTLESVAPLDPEIVAVDSGSTDGTIPLLERAGARVIRTEWRGYIAARRAGLEACTRPWVLFLDSDESLEPDLRGSIDAAIRRDEGDVGAYMMNRKLYYRGRALNFVCQPEHRLRLARRELALPAGVEPHDQVQVRADPVRRRVPLLPGTLRHDSIPSFPEFLAKAGGHAAQAAASLHASGRRGSLSGLIFSPCGMFLKQMVLKQAWRDGWPGCLVAASMSAYALAKQIALIELGRSGEADLPS